MRIHLPLAWEVMFYSWVRFDLFSNEQHTVYRKVFKCMAMIAAQKRGTHAGFALTSIVSRQARKGIGVVSGEDDSSQDMTNDAAKLCILSGISLVG